MAYLYIDSLGRPITRFSYSAGIEFDHCPYKFYLHRIMGWKEKTVKASLLFGRALESAIQHYHQHNGQEGVEEFERQWVTLANSDKISYTKVEKDWASLLRAGREMMKLYAIKQPVLPIPMDTEFQREFLREVFPGDPKYGGIQFYGKLDMIARVMPNHPLLSPDTIGRISLFRELLTDIKTGQGNVPDEPENDQQLRLYSWLRGIPDVAFLWFRKCSHGLKKGSNVTLLETVAPSMPAGIETVIAHSQDDGAWVVGKKDDLKAMDEFVGSTKSKAGLERLEKWLGENAYRVRPDQITKQKLQFVTGVVTPKNAAAAGRIVANQIVRVVAAWEASDQEGAEAWSNTFGVRYPHDDRKDPFYIAFVRNDHVYRNAMFEQKEDEFADIDTEEDSEGESNE